jgi:hypothetical protein
VDRPGSLPEQLCKKSAEAPEVIYLSPGSDNEPAHHGGSPLTRPDLSLPPTAQLRVRRGSPVSGQSARRSSREGTHTRVRTPPLQDPTPAAGLRSNPRLRKGLLWRTAHRSADNTWSGARGNDPEFGFPAGAANHEWSDGRHESNGWSKVGKRDHHPDLVVPNGKRLQFAGGSRRSGGGFAHKSNLPRFSWTARSTVVRESDESDAPSALRTDADPFRRTQSDSFFTGGRRLVRSPEGVNTGSAARREHQAQFARTCRWTSVG